jgi:hypothetical protein
MFGLLSWLASEAELPREQRGLDVGIRLGLARATTPVLTTRAIIGIHGAAQPTIGKTEHRWRLASVFTCLGTRYVELARDTAERACVHGLQSNCSAAVVMLNLTNGLALTAEASSGLIATTSADRSSLGRAMRQQMGFIRLDQSAHKTTFTNPLGLRQPLEGDFLRLLGTSPLFRGTAIQQIDREAFVWHLEIHQLREFALRLDSLQSMTTQLQVSQFLIGKRRCADQFLHVSIYA